MEILFGAYILTHVVSPLPQAVRLSAQGFEVSFHMASKKTSNPSAEALLNARGIPYFSCNGSTPDGAPLVLWWSQRDLRWAIAAAKPIINHDIYRYHYGDYSNAPGVVHVENKADFTAEISRIVQPTRRAEVQAAQATVAADWGLLDGKGGERLLELISRLASKPPHT